MATNMRYKPPNSRLVLKPQESNGSPRFTIPTSSVCSNLRWPMARWICVRRRKWPELCGTMDCRTATLHKVWWCRCQGGCIMHRCVWASKVFRVSYEMYLPGVRAALLRFRKVRRCNLSLTKTNDTVSTSVVRYYQAEKLSTSGVQAWWTIERALSAPCAAPLCTSLFLRDQLAKTEWMSLSGLLEGWRWLPIYGPSFGECKDIKQAIMRSFSYIEGLFDVSPHYCSYTFCLCSLLVVVAGTSGSFSV